MFQDPPLKTDGMTHLWFCIQDILLTCQVINTLFLCVFVFAGFLKVAMKSGWCGRHLQSLRHLTHNRRPRGGRHPWSQTLLNQEPVGRWLTVWSPCWGELNTMTLVLFPHTYATAWSQDCDRKSEDRSSCQELKKRRRKKSTSVMKESCWGGEFVTLQLGRIASGLFSIKVS